MDKQRLRFDFAVKFLTEVELLPPEYYFPERRQEWFRDNVQRSLEWADALIAEFEKEGLK